MTNKEITKWDALTYLLVTAATIVFMAATGIQIRWPITADQAPGLIALITIGLIIWRAVDHIRYAATRRRPHQKQPR